MFNSKNTGFGFGGMPGFGKGKKNTFSGGDFDRDGVPNRYDCKPLNFKKQGRVPLSTWIKENREDIDTAIRTQVPEAKIDDSERRMWVLNDEGLYNWARAEGASV